MRNPDSITWDVIINKKYGLFKQCKGCRYASPGLIYSATTVEVLPVNLDVYGNITSYGAPLTSGYTVRWYNHEKRYGYLWRAYQNCILYPLYYANR